MHQTICEHATLKYIESLPKQIRKWVLKTRYNKQQHPEKRTRQKKNATHLKKKGQQRRTQLRKIESDEIQHLMKQWKPIFMQVSEAIQKRTYVGSIGKMVSKVQKWMLKNGLDPKRQTRGHKTVDFPGLESGSTSINEVSRDNAGRLVRAIKLRNLDSKGPFGDRSDEESAPAMWAWFYYHKTLALAPRAKHSIAVPTVSYAIDMLQLLQEKQQKTTNLDPDTTKTKMQHKAQGK